MSEQTKEIVAKGKHVSWSLGDQTNVDQVRAGFAQITLGSKTLIKLAPDYNTPKASLKAALDKHFKGRDFLVRPLKDRRYAVVREDSTGDDVTASLEHGTLFEVGLETPHSRDPDFVEIELNALSPELEESICKEMKRQMKLCSRYMLSKKLVGVIDALHGLCVTGNGGMYSIPDRTVPVWDQVKKVIMDAGTGNQFAGYRVVFDDESCESTLNALTRSMEKEIEKIEGLVVNAETDLGKRALDTQLKRVKTLKGRTMWYEKMYNKKLKDITESLKILDGTLVLAVGNAASAD
ncbi:hypothetical protein CMI37_17690 [Candidatus Pacearchaeota archaeon]|nr:hypothetical protein [Candidatus Pacearchaeota archaeon]|tara:strand:+ start:1141 stop:2019 length:879 start_codon:yes stop_codon:yes gene_type:complete